MGACDFYYTETGKTAQEAFGKAVSQAQWEHGHGGYTGTIAEKHDFVEIRERLDPALPVRERLALARAVAHKMVGDGDRRIDDKWGPAGCIDCGPAGQTDPAVRAYLFFGWASS